MLASLVEAKLHALQYPLTAGFALEDDAKAAQLVLWLENRKIREYPPAQRAGLDYSKNPGAAWRANLQKYLRDLACPVALTDAPESAGRCYHWLLCHAVSLEYYDNSASINAAAAGGGGGKVAPAAGAAGAAAAADKTIVDLSDPTVVQTLDEVLTALNVAAATTKGASAEDKLRLVYQTVQRLRDATALESSQTTFKTEMFPLGFGTGDKVTNEAATVMRMLYVEDLRDLQRSVNAMLSHAQKFTANPKTNSRLGKVGR